MNIKRFSKRTLSVLLCVLILISSSLVGAISASAASWTRGTSSYIYLDTSNLYSGGGNSNTAWYYSGRYRLMVVTNSNVYFYAFTGVAGSSDDKLYDNNTRKVSKLLYFQTTNAFSDTIVSEGIDFITFIYSKNGTDLKSTSLPRSEVFDTNKDLLASFKSGYLFSGYHYTANYSGGISSEKGARMIFTTNGGTTGGNHPSVSMQHFGNELGSLKTSQTVVTTSGGSVNYNGYAINKVKNSTNVFGNAFSDSSADVNVTYSSNLTLTALPDENASFTGWYDEGDNLLSSSASYSYTVGGDKTIKAKFSGGVEATYAQNAVAGAGGTVSATLDGTAQSLPFSSTKGKNVTLTASANSGYVFSGWYDNSEYSGEPVSTDASYTYSVKGESTLYARFISSYSQSVTIDGSGSVSATCNGNAIDISSPYTGVDGDEITLSAASNSGYEFDGWYNGSSLLSSSEEYTYTVSGANAITAKFTEEPADPVRPSSGKFKFNAPTILYLDTTKNNWVANRVHIVLYDGTYAYSRVLSSVTYAKLAARTTKSIITKFSSYGITWADIQSISFVYFDNSTTSNSFSDGRYTDLFVNGELDNSAVSRYGISGYTAGYSEALADKDSSTYYYRVFSPASDENNAELSEEHATFSAGFPLTNQHVVEAKTGTYNVNVSTPYPSSTTGGTVTVEKAYTSVSNSTALSCFTELQDSNITKSNEGATLKFYTSKATKIVLKATVSDEEEYSFIGWYDSSGNKLPYTNKSNPQEYTYYPTTNKTIHARFAPIYQYEIISGKNVRIIKFNANDSISSTTIPSSFTGGYTVKEIASEAFKDSEKLKEIEIPSSVTKICDKAFEGCTGLNEVTIGNDDTVFEGEPFLNTRVADDPIILFGQTINSTARAHADNYYYLYFMPLTAVSPEDEYKYIYKVVDLGNDEIELVQYLGDRSAERITIPDTIDGKTVVGLGAKLYYQCKKTYYLYIPEHVRSIGKDALPKYTTYYDVASDNNTFKSEVDPNYNYANDIPDARSDLYSKDGLTFIRYAAGDGTRHQNKPEARKQYTVQDGVATIAEGAFKNSSVHINSITLPSSVTTIGKDAFNYCLNLRTINIPSSVTSIGDNAFMNCRSLPKIDVYGSLGDKIFWGCIKLSEVNIKGSGSFTIGSQAFSRCNCLNFVTDENNSITDIGTNAFEHCAKLSVIKSSGIVDKIINNNLIPYDLIPDNKRFITSDNSTFIVTDGVMKRENDGNNFGIPSDQQYANMLTLGIQKKNNNSIRFITAVNSELLKDSSIQEYGYLIGKIQQNSLDEDVVRTVRARMDCVTYSTEGIYKTELKGTDNKLCSDYGKYSANTNYKYVTVSIEDIDDPNNIVFTRFYIKTSDGKIFYSEYQTEESQTVQVLQYQTDEYGNQIYDENGNPVTEYADTEYQETVYNMYKGCAVQPAKFFS